MNDTSWIGRQDAPVKDGRGQLSDIFVANRKHPMFIFPDVGNFGFRQELLPLSVQRIQTPRASWGFFFPSRAAVDYIGRVSVPPYHRAAWAVTADVPQCG